jgi:Flp pilus assembly pilin Flp
MNDKKYWRDEKGAATAEYAIATMAAVGFAGLLVVIMRSDEVRGILFDLVKSALTFTNPNAAPTP